MRKNKNNKNNKINKPIKNDRIIKNSYKRK